MKIRTAAHPIRRALWRFESLCSRKQLVPFVGVLICIVLVSAI